METTLKYKINQYHQLKEMQKNLDNRIAELRNQILKLVPKGNSYHEEFTVTKHEKDCTSLDEAAFWLLKDAEHYCKLVPDPSLIEQAYLDGEISDAELRSMRNPKYVDALVVRKNVSSND